MKITFVLPGIGLSGGTKAVFEFANHLQDRGHEVTVVYPLLPLGFTRSWRDVKNLLGKVKSTAGSIKRGVDVDWFNLKARLLRVPMLAERFIPCADAIVATWWETAYYVGRYSITRGEKFYLVQHHEVWGGPEKEVNGSFELALRNIVNSTWLKDILQVRLNAPVEAVILHAPDWDEFYPEKAEVQGNPITILMPYRKEKWKGIEDGIEAFEIVRQVHPEIRLVLFGPRAGKDIPAYAEFHERPYGDRLRKIYNACDIFVFPSRSEGFGMPPMEAMACKVAVATTDVGAIPDYATDGETALVSPPGCPRLLAKSIARLVEDQELRKRISEAGHNHIRRFTWAKAARELEQVLSRAPNQKVE